MLLAPVVFSALAFLVALVTGVGQPKRKALLWVPAVLLLAFCAVGLFSVGLFYLPAALALVVAAIMGSRGRVSAGPAPPPPPRAEA